MLRAIRQTTRKLARRAVNQDGTAAVEFAIVSDQDNAGTGDGGLRLDEDFDAAAVLRPVGEFDRDRLPFRPAQPTGLVGVLAGPAQPREHPHRRLPSVTTALDGTEERSSLADPAGNPR